MHTDRRSPARPEGVASFGQVVSPSTVRGVVASSRCTSCRPPGPPHSSHYFLCLNYSAASAPDPVAICVEEAT